ncbi:MAG: homoserine dehydrogenase [Ardenticatenaceae bacterium]|nr:homoserine dehydrogenase [Ardenticatenaceae bacterium]
MKDVAVVVFGMGGVGQALVRQIVDGRSPAASRNQCRFNVVALVDSQNWLWQTAGLPDEDLMQAVANKQRGLPLLPQAESQPSPLAVLDRAATAGLKDVIVVDVTAVGGMEPVVDCALELGYSLAFANKKLFAGPLATSQKYFNHSRIRHESTVGGGQPVIATLRYLLDVNDPIERIEGQLSGTLGFVNGRLDQGATLSQAIAEAKAKGYTEPDPREDLSGMDVMRKVMILGRMAGWGLETADIEVESLYPAAMAGLTVAEFMAAAPQLDAAMQTRVEAARQAGNVLRYVAEVEAGRGRVGLKAIPANSPLANLKYVSFKTEYYNDEPLLIGGKGAGVEMTAAGVLGDMIDLVREIV